VKTASEMTYTVSGGALKSTQSSTLHPDITLQYWFVLCEWYSCGTVYSRMWH